MPAHIDIRLGRWQDAITANAKAIDADARYQAITGTLDADMPGYAAHNRHMLIYAAMMAGQGKLALDQARTMIAETPPETLKEGASGFDPMMTVPLEVMLRFGRWDDILAEPADYPEAMPFAPRVPRGGAGRCLRRAGQTRGREERAGGLPPTARARAAGKAIRRQFRRDDLRRAYTHGRGRNPRP